MSLKSSMNALLCRLDLTVGTAVTQLDNLKAMGIIASQGGRGQVVALKCECQGRHGYWDGQQNQSSDRNSLPRRNLWCWLVTHGIPRGKTDRNLLDSYFICIDRSSRSSELKFNSNHENRKSQPLNPLSDLRKFTDPEPLE